MDIGRPPEFGRDGTPPPIASEPVEVARWDLNQNVFRMVEGNLALGRLSEKIEGGNDAGLTRTVLALIPAIAADSHVRRVIEAVLRARGATHLTWKDVGPWRLHSVYTQYWRREDPTTQLPPGGSTEITVSIRVGLSQEHLREVATSLGVSGRGADPLGLSTQFSEKTATKVAISVENQVTRKVVLTNPSSELYRRIALWHLIHRLSLIASPAADSETELVWQVTEFVASDVTNATAIDLPRAGAS